MSRRSDPAQKPPPDLETLRSGMPRSTVQGAWHREHADRPGPDRGCWWFSSTPVGGGPEGRFDLTEPRGTCYLGSTLGVAARERCGRLLAAGAIPEDHLAGRLVSTVTLPPTTVADLTDPAGAHVGVTAELATGHDYPLTTQWATALDATDVAGIRYAPRFTPAGGPEHAMALFGAAGAAPDLHPVVSQPLAAVVADLGFRTVSLPSPLQLTVTSAPPSDGETGGPRS